MTVFALTFLAGAAHLTLNYTAFRRGWDRLGDILDLPLGGLSVIIPISESSALAYWPLQIANSLTWGLVVAVTAALAGAI
jgi:hypothetical protein